MVIAIDDATYVAAVAALQFASERSTAADAPSTAARFAVALADMELAQLRYLERQSELTPALLRSQI